MSDVIDLDALQPKAATIKIGDKEITLNPPRTGDVLKLGEAARRMNDIEGKSGDEVNAIVDEIKQHIFTIIPDLTGQELNTAQLLVLIKVISDMAIPPDAKELQKRGITVGDTDPKAP